ncbi:MAG: hypothetical protein U9R16_05810 [Campylobacterota bacterium]|nr:hypothetical protein [Campylobacterota bacterium]
MQVFGKFTEVHDLEYVTKCYLYMHEEGEEITVDDLNLLLKKKNKNVAGTIFLHNPHTVPVGYNLDEKLSRQEFKFDNKFRQLEVENPIRIIGRSLKKYRGKLIEIKYLFNYNKGDIQPTSTMEVFDMDLEKLHTNLLTVFAKEDNFQEYKNISYNGKFIFFAWGHKIDRHHTNIEVYASNIAQWAKKANKEIGFIYDGVMDEDDSFEYTRFISPYVFGKLKLIVPDALNKVFEKDVIEPYRIK